MSATCPDCRHAAHESLAFCPNMASDNDCSCTRRTAPRADLDELGRLLAEATPGPWEVSAWDSGLSYRELNVSIITESLGDHVATVDYDGNAEGPHGAEGADAALIAALVNAAPALLAEVAELRETVARVEALRDDAIYADFTPWPETGTDVHKAVRTDDISAALGGAQ